MTHASGLAGKVAIVTGMTRAMGAAIGGRLCAEGVSVVGCGRSVELGASVASRLTEMGADATFVPADVSEEGDVTAVVQHALDRHGRLDIVVNNAAATDIVKAGGEAAIVGEDLETFRRMFAVGTVGPFLFFKHAAPPMIERNSGVFVNISSTAAVRGAPGLPGYSASKGAIEALTRQAAADLGRFGIRCNVLQLGRIKTPDSGFHHDPDPVMEAAFREMVMTPQFADEHAVGGCVVFLASDDAAFITGETLRLDGGASVKTHIPRKPGPRE